MATIAEALQIAVDHHCSGRLYEAEVLYRRILDVDTEQPDGLHLLGVLCAQSGRFEEAAALIAQAIRHRPDQPDHHLHLGNALRMLGRNSEAAPAFQRSVALRPDHFDSWDALAAVSHGRICETALRHALALSPRQRRLWAALGSHFADLGRFDDLAALLVDLNDRLIPCGIFWKTPYYIAIDIANRLYTAGDEAGLVALFRSLDPILTRLAPLVAAWMGFLKGSWHAARGDISQAQATFDRVAPTLPLVRCFAFGDTFDERTAVDPKAWTDYRATLRDHGSVPDGDGPVLFCAADGLYAERFAPLFLASADAFARPGQRVHLHVVNPQPGALDRLASLGQGQSRLRLALSWEPAVQGLPTAADRMTYYTCVRFLRLPALMERYQAPIVVSDIDTVWLADPLAFADTLTDEAPLALVHNPRTLSFLYDSIAGGMVALRPAAWVQALFEDAARYLFHWFQQGRMEYFLDQIALSAAVARHAPSPQTEAIHSIPVADSLYRQGEGLVYQILAGKRDPDFGERVAALLAAGATPERLMAFVTDDQARARDGAG